MRRSLLKDLTKARDDVPTVHFIAGLAGSVLNFRPLARELKHRWRLRGVLYPVYAGGSPRCPSIDWLADEMVSALDDAEEPVILVGYSIGGTVAYALAQRLAQNGRRVAVVMLDTAVHELKQRAWRRQPAWLRAFLTGRRWLRLLIWIWPRRGLEHLLRGGRPRPSPIPSEPGLRIFHTESFAASRAYVPPMSKVPIVMVRAVGSKGRAWRRRRFSPDKDRGWSAVAPVIAAVPCVGTHLTIAKPANASRLAAALDEALALARRSVT